MYVINVMGDSSLKVVFHHYFPLVRCARHEIFVSAASNISSCDDGSRGRRLKSVPHVDGVYVACFESGYLW